MKTGLSSILLATVCISNSVAQAVAPLAVVVSACDVLRDPAGYNGKTVNVRGIYSVEGHGEYLRAEDCEGALANDLFKWPPVIFLSLSQKQMESRGRSIANAVAAMDQLSEAIRLQLRLKGPGAKVARVRATYVGLFETHKDIASRPGDGFGPSNAAPGQLYVDSVRDIVVEFEDAGTRRP